MPYAIPDAVSDWFISWGCNGDVAAIARDDQRLEILDVGSWTYAELLEMRRREDVGPIPGSDDWREFLFRVIDRFLGDVQNLFSPCQFAPLHGLLTDPQVHAALVAGYRGRPRPRLRPDPADGLSRAPYPCCCNPATGHVPSPARRRRSRYQRALQTAARALAQEMAWRTAESLVNRLGGWILTEPQLPPASAPLSEQRLLAAYGGQRVCLNDEAVARIVQSQSWWEYPGYTPECELQIVHRLTDWLAETSLVQNVPSLPWEIVPDACSTASAPLLCLQPKGYGTSVSLTPAEARQIRYHGAWRLIPWEEVVWRLTLDRTLDLWLKEVDTPGVHLARDTRRRHPKPGAEPAPALARGSRSRS